MSRKIIGVLAIQGDVSELFSYLESLHMDIECRYLKRRKDFDGIDAVAVPGGESGTIWRVLKRRDMLDKMLHHVQELRPFFGTCAGLILYARLRHHLGNPVLRFERNFYGRQFFSDFKKIFSENNEGEHPYIRAPKIIEVFDSSFKIFKNDEGRIYYLLSDDKNVLLMPGHPELNHTKDDVIQTFVSHLLSRNESLVRTNASHK